MHRLARAAFVLVAAGCPALGGGSSVDPSRSGPADVVINELARTGSAESPAWVELHNRSDQPVDLRGFTLASNVNARIATLPGMTLPAGAFLLVVLGRGADELDGSDGKATFHAPDGADAFEPDAGSVMLYRCAPSDACIVDYVGYRFRGEFIESDGHRHAVAAGQWSRDAQVDVGLFAEPGTSIGRDHVGTDTNSPDDWFGDGGIAALGPTPGAANTGAAPSRCPDPKAGPACPLAALDEIDAAVHGGAGDAASDASLVTGVKTLHRTLAGLTIVPDAADRILQWLVWQAWRDGKIGIYEREDLVALAARLGIDDARRDLLLRGCRSSAIMRCENGCPGGTCCYDEPRPPGAVTCAEICAESTPWCPAKP